MLSAKALGCIFLKILKMNLRTYAETFVTLLHCKNLLIGFQEYGSQLSNLNYLAMVPNFPAKNQEQSTRIGCLTNS